MPKTFVVLKESGVNSLRMCLLGEGETKAAAMADAFGPRESWSKWTRNSARSAIVREVEQDELDALRENVHAND
jgi:hypothetical protein